MKVGVGGIGVVSVLHISWCYLLATHSNKLALAVDYQFPSSVSAPYSWPLASTLPLLSTNDNECSFRPSFYLWLMKYSSMYDDYPTVLEISMGNSEAVTVWSANGNDPANYYPYQSHTFDTGLLLLNVVEGLMLVDGNGTVVWSPPTSGHLVRSMNLTCHGNLVLLGDNATIVWQSFDHPTDTWLPGQTLDFGQRLTSRASRNTLEAGKFYLSISEHPVAFIDTNPPLEYNHLNWSLAINNIKTLVSNEFQSMLSFRDSYGVNRTKYIRLDPDGHLTLYSYNSMTNSTTEQTVEEEELTSLDSCSYPTVCGNYGICHLHMCECPYDNGFNFFRPLNPSTPELGCQPITELSCTNHPHKTQQFLQLENITYFAFEHFYIGARDIASCKKACLEDCSCKAALFRHGTNKSSGNCSLPSQLLSLMYSDSRYDYHDIVFIKVERPVRHSLISRLVPSVTAGLLFIVLCAGAYYFVSLRRRTKKVNKSEYPPDVVVNTVAIFSFDSLRLATRNFQTQLGRGGFGCVFEGTLEDGTKVAIKRLHSSGQTRKEFLAEVNTIGNLHHYNLVRLLGFCENKSNRLLVYEYMPNGSLDKWVFNQGRAPSLPWSLRQRIITSIAKGLEYLHENCLQTVIHFDIKPQNILLDVDFTAKVADFGLAKMVDRDESQVMTIIRGTPGYIAPEVIGAQVISVKLDVYSFGILVLEVVSGRKNVGSSVDDALINLVKVKLEEDRLVDLIDGRAEDMQRHKEEAIKMMKVAIWCLQPHHLRPNMSMVVKILQDLPNIEDVTDLNYLTMVHEAASQENNTTIFTHPTESLLSGPR